MNCLLCNKTIKPRLTLKQILLPGKIEMPIVCSTCRQHFTPYQGLKCDGCSRVGVAGLCNECLLWEQKYGWHLHHQALYQYDEMMKDYMHRYKFMGDYRLRKVFQAEFSQWVNCLAADIVVPIPVTAATWQKRGFNQVNGLLHGADYQELLVAKVKDKRAQSSKTRSERLKTSQPFALQLNQDIAGKNVLLIDDVYTTGRTLYHAAVLFKRAGCNKVVSVSLAR